MTMQRPSPSLAAFLALVLLCAALPATAQVSPVALAHQEKALALLGQAGPSGDGRGMQHALLHALTAQTLPPPEGAGLAPPDLGAFLAAPPAAAFALRWRSPSDWLGGAVPALAWSPDGAWLATAGSDARVRLWDPASGALRAALAPDRSWIESLAFSPDGRLLVAGAIPGGVHVWTLDEDGAPAPRAVLVTGRGAVRAVTVCPDGRWLAAGADDGRVHLWALPDGLDGTRATTLLSAIGPKLLALAFDATGDLDGRLRLWDLGAEPPEPVTLETAGG